MRLKQGLIIHGNFMAMSTKFWVLQAACLLSFGFATGITAADAPLRPGDQIGMRLGGVPSTEISAISGVYTIDGFSTDIYETRCRIYSEYNDSEFDQRRRRIFKIRRWSKSPIAS